MWVSGRSRFDSKSTQPISLINFVVLAFLVFVRYQAWGSEKGNATALSQRPNYTLALPSRYRRSILADCLY
jgi:hypothetical protein